VQFQPGNAKTKISRLIRRQFKNKICFLPPLRENCTVTAWYAGILHIVHCQRRFIFIYFILFGFRTRRKIFVPVCRNNGHWTQREESLRDRKGSSADGAM
jgi:hypothetical protein